MFFLFRLTTDKILKIGRLIGFVVHDRTPIPNQQRSNCCCSFCFDGFGHRSKLPPRTQSESIDHRGFEGTDQRHSSRDSGYSRFALGVYFSLSLQRFDSRSKAVVDEANVIGTAYLRAQLLPASLRSDVQVLLRNYLGLRVRASGISLADQDNRETILEQAINVQNTLWGLARQAAEMDQNPVTSGLFITSLNELIDAFSKRDAELARHVPEVVLFLLYGTLLLTGGIVGFCCGVGGHRPSGVNYIMVVLIVILVFIILDLDRPRRGLIEVSQKGLVDLQAAIGTERDTDRRGLNSPGDQKAERPKQQ